MFAVPNAVQIRVSLDHIEPAVWRRLIVPSHWNLEQLHLTVQVELGGTTISMSFVSAGCALVMSQCSKEVPLRTIRACSINVQ